MPSDRKPSLAADLVRPPEHFLTPYFVDEVDYNIVLLYSEAVEMLPNSFFKTIFALPSGLLFSDHGWGVLTDAARTREHSVMELAGEGGRGAQLVLAAIGM